MLVSFSVENFRSFKEKTTFTMDASDGITNIIGKNSSGKTNLFHAINFLKNIVIDKKTTQSNYLENVFILTDILTPSNAVKFNIEVILDSTHYKFDLSYNNEGVREENLYVIEENSIEHLFKRNSEGIFFPSKKYIDKRESIWILNPPKNQSILNKSYSDLYYWFKNDLVLVGAKFSEFDIFFDENSTELESFNKLLNDLDTGIKKLSYSELIILEKGLSNAQIKYIRENYNSGTSIKYVDPDSSDIYILKYIDQQLCYQDLYTCHEYNNGDETYDLIFGFDKEATSIRRLIDILPAFIELSKPSCKKTYIIDELDQSLHVLLFVKILKIFFSMRTSEYTSQLIFNTNNFNLNDSTLFSSYGYLRDINIWECKRDKNLVSSLKRLKKKGSGSNSKPAKLI